MTNVPTWLDDVIVSFGRQMQLNDFRMNAHGVAAVSFENGVNLSFEYVEGALVVSIGVPCGDDAAAMKRLLALSHWGMRGEPVRAVYKAKSGFATVLLRLDERAVTVARIESAVRMLWDRIEMFRRSVA